MPLLTFDPETGITAPDSATIRDAVAANWENAFNAGDGSPVLDTEAATPAGQLVDSETMILAQINAELLYLFSQLNPRLAEGVWQDAIGYIYFLTRKIAEPTTVQVRCTGLQGTTIPIGAQVESDTGERYECTVATEIPVAGNILVPFQNLEAGPVECPAGTINKIITVIPGWDTVSNPASGVTGRDRESQFDFEQRRYESVAKNSHGAVASLQGALLATESVTDCKVLENPSNNPITLHGVEIPGHSIAACIYGGADIDIAETIYNKKDAGCGTTGNTEITYSAADMGGAVYRYQIVRPTTRDLRIYIKIHRTETTPANIANRIKSAVVNDFIGQNTDSGNPRVGLASTIYASRFSVAVVKTAGVPDLVEITIGFADGEQGGAVVIDGYTEPVLVADDVIVEEV